VEVEMEDKKTIVLSKMSEAAKPLRPGDIAEITGIDKNEIAKLIKVLKDEDKIYSPKRCFYEVK